MFTGLEEYVNRSIFEKRKVTVIVDLMQTKMEGVLTTTISVEELLRQLEQEIIIANPEWQRNDVWSDGMRMELIQSIREKLPIPQLTFWSRPGGTKEVVDGRQRITAILRYYTGKVRTGKEIPKFKDLTDYDKRLFMKTNVYIMLLPETAEKLVIADYFQRINVKGKSLSNGEMINSHTPFSAVVKEVNRLFFTSNDFSAKWCELFGVDGLEATQRMSHLENTVPYLTSSLKGSGELNQSYPVIVDTLKKTTKETVDEHMPLFMERMNVLLDVFKKLKEKCPAYIEECKTGLPKLRQMAAVWSSIIEPYDGLPMENIPEFWSSFIKKVEESEDEDVLHLGWYGHMRRNGKKDQLRTEIEFAIVNS